MKTYKEFISESKKSDLDKVVKVIKSAKSEEQLEVATNLARNWIKKYSQSTLIHDFTAFVSGDWSSEGKYMDFFLDKLKFQRSKIEKEIRRAIS